MKRFHSKIKNKMFLVGEIKYTELKKLISDFYRYLHIIFKLIFFNPW
jgi:hypothetical protein